MNLEAILREVEVWPLEDRMRLVQALLDQILDGNAPPELTAAQKAELDRRLAELQAAPDNVLSWDAIKEHVRRPR